MGSYLYFHLGNWGGKNLRLYGWKWGWDAIGRFEEGKRQSSFLFVLFIRFLPPFLSRSIPRYLHLSYLIIHSTISDHHPLPLPTASTWMVLLELKATWPSVPVQSRWLTPSVSTCTCLLLVFLLSWICSRSMKLFWRYNQSHVNSIDFGSICPAFSYTCMPSHKWLPCIMQFARCTNYLPLIIVICRFLMWRYNPWRGLQGSLYQWSSLYTSGSCKLHEPQHLSLLSPQPVIEWHAQTCNSQATPPFTLQWIVHHDSLHPCKLCIYCAIVAHNPNSTYQHNQRYADRLSWSCTCKWDPRPVSFNMNLCFPFPSC